MIFYIFVNKNGPLNVLTNKLLSTKHFIKMNVLYDNTVRFLSVRSSKITVAKIPYRKCKTEYFLNVQWSWKLLKNLIMILNTNPEGIIIWNSKKFILGEVVSLTCGSFEGVEGLLFQRRSRFPRGINIFFHNQLSSKTQEPARGLNRRR